MPIDNKFIEFTNNWDSAYVYIAVMIFSVLNPDQRAISFYDLQDRYLHIRSTESFRPSLETLDDQIVKTASNLLRCHSFNATRTL